MTGQLARARAGAKTHRGREEGSWFCRESQMSSWMWEIVGTIYIESGYFNLGNMEAARRAQLWGSVALSELKEPTR